MAKTNKEAEKATHAAKCAIQKAKKQREEVQKKKKKKPSNSLQQLGQDMRRVSKANEKFLSKAPFQRLVKEIAEDVMPGVTFRTAAIQALQLAVEAYSVHDFEAATILVAHAKRVTLMPKDVTALKRIKKHYDLP